MRRSKTSSLHSSSSSSSSSGVGVHEGAQLRSGAAEHCQQLLFEREENDDWEGEDGGQGDEKRES